MHSANPNCIKVHLVNLSLLVLFHLDTRNRLQSLYMRCRGSSAVFSQAGVGYSWLLNLQGICLCWFVLESSFPLESWNSLHWSVWSLQMVLSLILLHRKKWFSSVLHINIISCGISSLRVADLWAGDCSRMPALMKRQYNHQGASFSCSLLTKPLLEGTLTTLNIIFVVLNLWEVWWVLLNAHIHCFTQLYLKAKGLHQCKLDMKEDT